MSSYGEEIDRALDRLNAIAGEHGDFLVLELPPSPPGTGNFGDDFLIAKITRNGGGVVLEFGDRRYACNAKKLREAIGED